MSAVFDVAISILSMVDRKQAHGGVGVIDVRHLHVNNVFGFLQAVLKKFARHSSSTFM